MPKYTLNFFYMLNFYKFYTNAFAFSLLLSSKIAVFSNTLILSE